MNGRAVMIDRGRRAARIVLGASWATVGLVLLFSAGGALPALLEALLALAGLAMLLTAALGHRCRQVTHRRRRGGPSADGAVRAGRWKLMRGVFPRLPSPVVRVDGTDSAVLVVGGLFGWLGAVSAGEGSNEPTSAATRSEAARPTRLAALASRARRVLPRGAGRSRARGVSSTDQCGKGIGPSSRSRAPRWASISRMGSGCSGWCRCWISGRGRSSRSRTAARWRSRSFRSHSCLQAASCPSTARPLADPRCPLTRIATAGRRHRASVASRAAPPTSPIVHGLRSIARDYRPRPVLGHPLISNVDLEQTRLAAALADDRADSAKERVADGVGSRGCVCTNLEVFMKSAH